MTLAQRIAAFIPPLQQWYPITTPYGGKTAKGPDAGEPHWGLDFGTPVGTPLHAISDGIVRPANSAPGGGTAGNTLVIDYGNGITVLAGHLSDMFVKPGDRVKAGDWIANTGNTGITTGPHLHLQAWRNGQQIDPLDLFDWARDAFDPADYASSHGASVPGGGIDLSATVAALAQPKRNGVCQTGFVAGSDIEKVLSDEFGRLPIVGGPAGLIASISNWLPGGFDPNMCYPREQTAQTFYQAAQNVPQASDLPFADWGEAITGLVTAILNPENWARIFAIFIGFIMTGAGAYMIWRAV